MPFIFSYGTLQQASVQLATFGRLLDGRTDDLLGFELSSVPIADAQLAAARGRTHNANITLTGRNDHRVSGTVFEITDAELAAADEYEKGDAYERIAVTLASGKRAWVYVHAGAAKSTSHQPMQPWFIATETFTPRSDAWAKYVAWSGLTQLDEVVSLDPMLCPSVLPDIKPQYWPHIVNEDF